MRHNGRNTSEFELLPTNVDFGAQKEDPYGQRDSSKSPKPWSWRSPSIQHALYATPLIAALAPVVLLVAFSSNLSSKLGSNGCTSSGEFVIPWTTSIWDPKRFFAITVTFFGSEYTSCNVGPDDSSALLACTGYSFTQVKVIDIAWDVLVGRGGQAVLVLVGYKVFGRIVKVLMRQGEVGYDLFAAVAFDSGSAASFVTLARHALGWTPVPRTRRAALMYVGMTLATLYIVIVPSLLAAMTGYTSYYGPAMDFHAYLFDGTLGLVDCGGSIAPVWGMMDAIPSDGFHMLTPTVKKHFPIILENGYETYFGPSPQWVDYYHRYSAVYDACPVQLNISDCKQAQRDTYVHESYGRTKVRSPMPGIVPFANSSSGTTKSTHWVCADKVFETKSMYNLDRSGNVFGTCRAGSGYAWGFSFLLTFVTSILNLLFVLLMYGLCLAVRRHGASGKEVGEFKDAVTMVTLAQKQYGAKIGEWSSSTLQKEVVQGRFGMSVVDARPLRRRSRRSEGQHEFGDPLAGDWGGDVVVSDRR